MLTEEEKQTIKNIAGRSPTRRAGCIEAMKVVQKNHGWVSDESIKGIAEILGMTADELDGVATFYSHIFRKPVGRHVILVCENISCWIMGFGKILAHLTTRLAIESGGTTPDQRFTLLPVACLGACDHAPAMMIDDELYGDLTPERIDEILDRHP